MPGNLQDAYMAILAARPYLKAVLRPGQRLVGIMSYTYNVTVGSVATPLTLAAGPISASIETHADSDFAISDISACLRTGANGDMKVNRNVTLQIEDLQTGKRFYNRPTVLGLVSGGGGFPFVWPATRLVRANSPIQFTAQNRDTATDYLDLFVALGGTRLFYAER